MEATLIKWVVDLENKAGKVWKDVRNDFQKGDKAIAIAQKSWQGLQDKASGFFRTMRTRTNKWSLDSRRSFDFFGGGLSMVQKKLKGFKGFSLPDMAAFGAFGEGIKDVGSKVSSAFTSGGGEEVGSFVESVNQMNQHLGLSRTRLSLFKKELVNAGVEGGSALNETAAAAKALTEAGVTNLDMLLKLAPAAANYATATTTSVETASKLAYRLADDYGYSASQIANVFNTTRKVGQQTAADTGMLSDAMLQQIEMVGPALKKMSADQSAALLSNLAGVTGSLSENWGEAGSSMADALAKGIGGDKEAQQQMGILLGRPFKEIEDRLKSGDIEGLFDNLAGRINKMSDSSLKPMMEMMEFQGSVSAFKNLGSNIGSINSKLAVTGNSAAAMKAQFMSASLEMADASDANKTAFEKFSEATTKGIASMSAFGVSGVEVLDFMKEFNPMSAAAGLNLLVMGGKGFGSVISGAGGAMKPMLGFGMASLTALSPILLIIAAVAAVAAGVYLLWKHSDTVRAVWADKVLPVLRAVWEAFKPVVLAAMNLGKIIWDVIVSSLSKVWTILQVIWQVTKPIRELLMFVGNIVWNVLVKGFQMMGKVIKFLILKPLTIIMDVAGWIIKKIASFVDKTFGWVLKVLDWLGIIDKDKLLGEHGNPEAAINEDDAKKNAAKALAQAQGDTLTPEQMKELGVETPENVKVDTSSVDLGGAEALMQMPTTEGTAAATNEMSNAVTSRLEWGFLMLAEKLDSLGGSPGVAARSNTQNTSLNMGESDLTTGYGV